MVYVETTVFTATPPLALVAAMLLGLRTPVGQWVASLERKAGTVLNFTPGAPSAAPTSTPSYGVQIIAGVIICLSYVTMLGVYVVETLRNQPVSPTVIGIVYGGVVAALSVYGVHLGGSIAGQSASLTTGIVTQVASQAAQLALTQPPVQQPPISAAQQQANVAATNANTAATQANTSAINNNLPPFSSSLS